MALPAVQRKTLRFMDGASLYYLCKIIVLRRFCAERAGGIAMIKSTPTDGKNIIVPTCAYLREEQFKVGRRKTVHTFAPTLRISFSS